MDLPFDNIIIITEELYFVNLNDILAKTRRNGETVGNKKKCQ